MDITLVYKEFGKRLRNARNSLGLTQEELAVRVGLSRTSITNIEQGRQHIPFHMLFILADAVGSFPSKLLPDRESISRSSEFDRKLLPLLENEGLDWVKGIIASEKQKGGNDE